MEKAPSLRRFQFPTVGGRKVREGALREQSSERGYDHIWQKLSARYRRKNPFCRFCEQQGFEASLADVTDHIIPVRDNRDLRLTWSNLQSLCNRHHNGEKRRLEEYARNTGMLDELPKWCADPDSRPRRLG